MLRLKEKIKGLFKRKKNDKPVNTMKFKTLSPTKNADIDKYEDALDFVFSNNEIKNVAITGAYCSGKSSIIETYEKNNKRDVKLLHISLAHFCAINQVDTEETNKNDGKNANSTNNKKGPSNKKRSTIESKILNQLIQQVPSKKIRFTKFKIDRTPGRLRTFSLSIILCVFLALLVYILKYYSWIGFYEKIESDTIKKLLGFSTIPESRIASAIILLIIIGFIFFKLVYAQYTKSFIRKISFQGNEIDIGKEPKSSFFDKYLNEVLYVFSEVDEQAIVFEDIDRFNDIALFERLREINTLINAKRKIDKKHKEPLRFIYMMRDDLFVDFKDRTKFFDFIIPVIPILDGSNSYGVLKRYLTEDGIIESFDNHFLREISLYIDDCRVLKNINNELLIYHDKLKDSKLDLNRLLAILTYKNIFPHDYDELRFNRGCVYSFFAAEARMKEGLKAPYKESENKIRDEIKAKDLEYRAALEEIENKYKTNEPISADDLENYADAQNAKTHLRMEHEGVVDRLNEDLKQILKKQTEIDNIPLNELLSRNSEAIFNNDYLKETINVSNDIIDDKYFGLLKFLLSSGYIDASYPDYMTYYYENGLSISDNYFIRAVLERNNQEYSYKIDNPRLVIDSLKPYYFSQPATLNYDLYDFIFSIRADDYKKQIFNIMSFFGSSRRVDYKDFIEGYLLSGRNIEIFFELLLNTWKDIFDWVEEGFSDEALKELSIMILKYCDAPTLVGYRDSRISEYLSSMPNIFLLGIHRNNLYSALELLDVKFSDLRNECIDSDALENLYNKELYELNEDNISYLLIKKCNVNDINILLVKFFTFVLRHKEYPLCLYASNNLDDVIPVYMQMYNGEIEDDSDIVCQILNLTNENNALQYINRIKTKIVDVSMINNLSFIPLLFNRNCIKYIGKNIVTWFNSVGEITPEIVKFIDSDSSNITYDIDDPHTRIFLIALLGNEELSVVKYCQIVQSLGESAIDFIISAHPSEYRMVSLIAFKVIFVSPKITECIKQRYHKILGIYICSNIDDYFSGDAKEVEVSDLELALSSSIIDETKKIDLLKKYPIPIPIIEKKYSDNLKKFILEHNFDPNDLEMLVKDYNNSPDYVKEKVVSYLIANPSKIIRVSKDINRELREILLVDASLGLNTKLKFLSIFIDDMEKEELVKVLLAFGADKIVDNINGGNRKVAYNEMNRNILRLLWKKRIIEYPVVTSSGMYYQKIRYIDKLSRPRVNLPENSNKNDNRG